MLKRTHEDWLCELERFVRAATLGLPNNVCPYTPDDATLSMRLLSASAKELAEQNMALRSALAAAERELEGPPF